MPPPDREKLRAGLSSLLAGDIPVAEPQADAMERILDAPLTVPVERSTAERPPGEAVARAGTAPAQRAAEPEAAAQASEAAESAHVRTSTGYVREGGERVYRVSVMLTRDERRHLREQADDEGVSITDLVRRALKL